MEQNDAFKKRKDIMSRRILLRYLDFKLPFDDYTDDCDYQLGGDIIQNGNPVAIYSRKFISAQ